MSRRKRRKASQRKRNRKTDRRRRKKVPAWPLFTASALIATVGTLNLLSPRTFAMSGGIGRHGNRPVVGLVDGDGSRMFSYILLVAAVGILLVGIKVIRSQRPPR